MELKERSVESRGDSLLDEIEARLEKNYKIGIMLGDQHSNIMTEDEKRSFREKEYQDYEGVEQSKSAHQVA